MLLLSLGHIEPITLSEAVSFVETDWRHNHDALPCTIEQPKAGSQLRTITRIRFIVLA